MSNCFGYFSRSGYAAVLVLVQAVHATEVGPVLAALLDRAIVALLLGVLDHPEGVLVRAVAADVLQEVPHRRPETLHDRGDEEALGPVQGLEADVDDVLVRDGHGKAGSVGEAA
jgi:hypothetical protein